MAYPKRILTVDDLFVLSQYPKKTMAQIATELKCSITRVRNSLLQLGKAMHKRGPREIQPDPVVTEIPPSIPAE